MLSRFRRQVRGLAGRIRQLSRGRLQAAFRPRRNSQPSRADGVLLGSGPPPRFSCTWTVRVRRVRVLGGQGKYIWRVAIEGQQVG